MKKNYLLSFFIPISILLLIFLILRIFPFGDLSIVVIDSDTQYVEFINYLKSIFLSNNDFKYTFSASLGENFIPLLGYYLMSPLNLITLLFSPETMKISLTIIMIIKVGLCGLSFNYYLSKKNSGIKNLIFSTAYALMSYNLVYIYHTMWLDSIILFPLVILGLDYIFEKKSPFLYITTLSLSIILNYYIGFIICLATVIYFIYRFIRDYNTINKLKTFINYSISSLLSGLNSMFILLPSIMGLQSSKASFSLSNINFNYDTSYLKIIGKSFTAAFGEGETWHGGPMIACGMLILALTILFFMNKNISKREKIASYFLIIFTATTFAISGLNLIFHGLTTPNCFDYRQAFIMVFFLLIIAKKSLDNLNYNKNNLSNTLYIFIILSILLYMCDFNFFKTTYGLTIILSLILVFIIIIILKKNKNIIKYLLIIELLDLTIGGIAAIATIVYSDRQSSTNYYNYVEQINNTVDKLKNIDNSFYRMEQTFKRSSNSINDSMIFNYNGISHFDSTTDKNVESFLEKLGFRKLLTRAYYNKYGSTTLVDSILGIKYVLSYEQIKDYNLLIDDDIKVYKNPYYLSLGYAVNKNIYDLVIDEDNYNTFNIQNDIAKYLTNGSKDIYKKADYTISYKDLKKESNTYIGNGTLTYTINVLSNDSLYFYFPTDGSIQTIYQDAKMYVNDEYKDMHFSKYNWGIVPLGKYEIGDTVKITFEVNNKLTIYDNYFYYENIDTFKEYYDILSKDQLNITKKSSSKLNATITLDSPKTILLSIPYDKGWQIKVDNKIIKQKKVLNVLTSIDLDKGKHNIELVYTPKGLNLGIIISSISISTTIIYLIIKKSKY